MDPKYRLLSISSRGIHREEAEEEDEVEVEEEVEGMFGFEGTVGG
jgi:hypothetical protein